MQLWISSQHLNGSFTPFETKPVIDKSSYLKTPNKINVFLTIISALLLFPLIRIVPFKCFRIQPRNRLIHFCLIRQLLDRSSRWALNMNQNDNFFCVRRNSVSITVSCICRNWLAIKIEGKASANRKRFRDAQFLARKRGFVSDKYTRRWSLISIRMYAHLIGSELNPCCYRDCFIYHTYFT